MSEMEPRRRRSWTTEEKWRLVEEARLPGNAVAEVARRRGVNNNQLFGWIRAAEAGKLGPRPASLCFSRRLRRTMNSSRSESIDAVIAALLLKMLWQPYRDGDLTKETLETSAFTIFLYARMLGCAARSSTTSTAAGTWTRGRQHLNASTCLKTAGLLD